MNGHAAFGIDDGTISKGTGVPTQGYSVGARKPGLVSRVLGGGAKKQKQNGAQRRTVNAMKPRGPGSITQSVSAPPKSVSAAPTAGSGASTAAPAATQKPRTFGTGAMAGGAAAGGIGGYFTGKYMSMGQREQR